MTAPSWEEIKQAFQTALEHAPQARGAYLEQLAADAPQLHAEVVALLDSHDQAEGGDFLGTLEIGKQTAGELQETIALALPTVDLPEGSVELPTLAQPSMPIPTAQPQYIGEMGDYQLVRQIGRGGMGVVYEAYEPKLRRTVALKVIAAGGLSAPEDIARFHLEAEAAGRLDHPGIVPVYEVGEHEGHHFYSMAYVPGESLASYVGPKGKRLPVRRAAQLMEAVCRAVQYAHDRAVIHRDIKPANIMLDAQDQPRLTDFGLAKVLREDQGLTVTGQVMGTPNYMAPEQAKGQHDRITNRTDVYSLGATLYALLSGNPPIVGKNLIDTLRKVELATPETLTFRGSRVPLDLSIICDKCLAKQPEDRYESAAALADDLQRYLAGYPISARAMTPAERLVRWCRRNPLVATLLGAIAVTLVTATVVSMGLMFRARAAQARAEANLNLIETILDEVLISVSEEDLAELPGTQLLRERLLSTAERYYRQLGESEQVEPGSLARAALVLGRLQAALGQYDQSRESLERALTNQRELVDQHPNQVPHLLKLAEMLNEYARLGERIWNNRPMAEPDEASRAGLALWQTRAAECLEQREQAADLNPQDRELRRLVANAQMNLASAKQEAYRLDAQADKLAAAEKLMQTAQALRQQLAKGDQADTQVQIDLAKGYAALADLCEATGKPAAEALGFRQQAIQLLEELPAKAVTSDTTYELALGYQACGRTHAAANEIEAAIGCFEKLGVKLQPLLLSNPGVFKYRKGVADAQYSLAQLTLKGKDIVGLDYFQDCQQTLANTLMVDPTNTEAIRLLVSYTKEFALLLRDDAHLQEALACVQQAHDLLKDAAGRVPDRAAIDEALKTLESQIKELQRELDVAESTA